eukprot:TRINITY_DN11560_c0_g1_i2.p1 TRINITY_DN11560_c0_g1~~TRINITY_DN11560_c0_g1_i2.p1  ORF type:complete len:246 (+),score=10.18 TRINITY_DN11560_c0_g1_i2:98-739(+)
MPYSELAADFLQSCRDYAATAGVTPLAAEMACIMLVSFASVGVVFGVCLGAARAFRRRLEKPEEIKTKHLYEFCSECAAVGLYGRNDVYLNGGFTMSLEKFPSIKLKVGERLTQEHVKDRPPVALMYRYEKRWTCNKCEAEERTEDRIVTHCLACPARLPHHHYPSRGWWPCFDMHQCTGTHPLPVSTTDEPAPPRAVANVSNKKKGKTKKRG